MSRRPRPLAIAATYAAVLALSCFFILPFAWMVLTALKDPSEVFTQLLPSTPRFSNFHEALTQPALPFGRFFLNTAFLTVTCTTLSLLASSLVAYGLVRIPFRGRNVVFFAILSTMMVPAIVMMIPTFWLFQKLGWVDTFLPFLVPALCGNPFHIFFMRQYFKTLPDELFEAARVDGCNHLQMYAWIVLPLSRPVLAALTIFSFLFYWNDFLGPLLYLHSIEMRTVTLGLYAFSGMYGTDWELMMAASLVAITPVLVVFFALQKYFERGIVLSGLKG